MPTRHTEVHCVLCGKTERGPLNVIDRTWTKWRFWSPVTEHACPACVRHREPEVAARTAASRSAEAKAAWLSRRNATWALRARRTASAAGRVAP